MGFSGDGLNSSSINGKSFELYAVNEVTPTGDIDYEKDTDQDELPDYYEEEIGTDSLNPDSDGDGPLDPEDDMPFKDDFKELWYKLTVNEKEFYVGLEVYLLD